MKFTLLPLLLLLLTSCSTNKIVISIPPQEAITVNTPSNGLYEATIKNKSLKEIEVKVVDKTSKEFISGFGLGMQGNETVRIVPEGQLVLTNPSNNTVSVRILMEEKDRQLKSTTIAPNKAKESQMGTKIATVPDTNRKYVSFTLSNKTPKSIPLLIPSVMNPNLSPFSKSGVDLKIGQKILFREKGKKYTLLTVDNTIADGAVLEVGQLLRDRKLELGL